MKTNNSIENNTNNKLTINDYAKKMAHLNGCDKYAHLLNRKIYSYLRSAEYITFCESTYTNITTDKGFFAGLIQEPRIDSYGRHYNAILLSEKAMNEIAPLIMNFKEAIDRENGGLYFTSAEKKAMAQGTFQGRHIKFKRLFAKHFFTDDEIRQLLNGETITISSVRGDETVHYTGHIQALQNDAGYTYYRFVPDFSDDYVA